MSTLAARTLGLAAPVASFLAWGAAALIACETASCSACGAGTAWEMVGQTRAEQPPAVRPAPSAPAPDANAAPAASAITTGAAAPAIDDPRIEAHARLNRPVSVVWRDVPLADAFEFIRAEAGVDMMVLWIDEDNPTVGLRRERVISVTANARPLVDLLEKVLERADTRAKGLGSTWQISDTGTLQVGPRERLNRWTRTDAYDAADLLMIIKDWGASTNALVGSYWNDDSRTMGDSAIGFSDTRPLRVRAEELRTVITTTCEPHAWVDNGGDAASIIFQRGSKAFVVRAPDYVHRAIDGYHPRKPTPSRVIAPESPQPAPPAKKSPEPASRSGD